MSRASGAPQDEVTRFLKSGKAFPGSGPVDHVQTHCAHVFLGGDLALKMKRAVCYDYLDQSTPELRHALLDRELVLNRPTAPMIYRDVVAVTRATGGGLEIGGAGPPVEWVLRMHRFAADSELTAVAKSGRLTDLVAEALGGAVRQYHDRCPVLPSRGDDLIREILDELDRVLTPFESVVGDSLVAAFLGAARLRLADLAPVLLQRSKQGHVRRGHGDLHLRNLVLIDGKPVLFDALEFDERLGTCDVLYDLAFLLMDLCHQGYHRPANIAMTAYLLAASGAEDGGLSALPLFMSVRAAIRAMVLLQTDQATGKAGQSRNEARHYLVQATGYLDRASPVLVAVGGMSGTGKTVLSRDLAARIGPCPGAVHLRTDTERKALPGLVDYAQTARDAIYDRLANRTSDLLEAGRSVILDATFLKAAQRDAVEALARRLDVEFHGLWLTAPEQVLIDRVASRECDASDADAEVVRAQAKLQDAVTLVPGWTVVEASGPPSRTRAAASAALASVLRDRDGDGTRP